MPITKMSAPVLELGLAEEKFGVEVGALDWQRYPYPYVDRPGPSPRPPIEFPGLGAADAATVKELF